MRNCIIHKKTPFLFLLNVKLKTKNTFHYVMGTLCRRNLHIITLAYLEKKNQSGGVF